MRKFVFKLQTKLDIAKRQEELAIEHLALRIQDRNTIIDNINANMARLNKFEDSIRNLPFKETIVIKDYLPVIRNNIQDLEIELLKAEERVETARNILVECKKETKTLTKLRENDWQRYLYELNLEEQREIDEIAINNHFRNN